jgi:hypothetical protein
MFITLFLFGKDARSLHYVFWKGARPFITIIFIQVRCENHEVFSLVDEAPHMSLDLLSDDERSPGWHYQRSSEKTQKALVALPEGVRNGFLSLHATIR